MIKKLLSGALAAGLAINAVSIPVAALANPALNTPQVPLSAPFTPSGQSLSSSLSNHSTKGADRLYTASTASLDGYNLAELSFGGNALSIKRRSHKAHNGPDQVVISQYGTATLTREGTWAYFSEDNLPHGYDLTVDLSALSPGSYTIKISSKDTYTYTMTQLSFTKTATDCYFLRDTAVSKQYNYSVLQKLEEGGAPDDFSALVEMYGGESGDKILSQIQAKALEVTRGKRTDRDKVMAVTQWVADNVAYDAGMIGDGFYDWIKKHPADEVRLDDPLNAFTQRYALCYGFARLTTLMMGYAGIPCVYVTGCLAEDQEGNINSEINTADIPDVMNHAWNAVKIDGAWYFVDTSNDALQIYYRTNKAQASTGYTESARAPLYLTTFPSLDRISKTHIALRLGVKNRGTKLAPVTVPNGWSGSSFYLDGVKAKKTWMKIDGNIHYFNTSGNTVKGWQQLDDYWRYFDEDGVMATGRTTITEGDGEQLFRFDADGCVTADGDWVTFKGATRYYNGKEMLTGWEFVDGAWRYFDDTGAMYKDDKKALSQGGNKYYFTELGELKVQGAGWVTLGDQVLYFDGHNMYTGLRRISGREYLFDEQGIMLTGWQTHDGKTYYFDEDGAMRTGWMQLEEDWYYIDRAEGRYTGSHDVGGGNHYFDAQGKLSTGGWVNVGSGTLYFADSKTKSGVQRGGTIAKGWRRIDGNLYFFDKDTGFLYTGPSTLLNQNNNKWYTVDAKGVATKME